MSDAELGLRATCYALAGCFSVVAVWSAWRLVLLQRAAPNWTQQKLSHVLTLAIGCG